MDPITAALVTKAGNEAVDVMKKESESFLAAALGEPAKALGGLITDHVNARRHKNLIAITVMAKQRLLSAGVSPKEVPLSIFIPPWTAPHWLRTRTFNQRGRTCWPIQLIPGR
jgi:hypothetical protein